jgi:hypothetical protein
VEKSAMAGGKNFATNGGTIFNGQRKNSPRLAEKSSTFSRNSHSGRKISLLWFVTIFLENSAAGRLWSCGMPSLAWNYLESFLQCGILYYNEWDGQ